MENANLYLLFLTAFIPIIVGALWYHPSLFGERVAGAVGQSSNQIGILNNPKKLPFLYLFGLLMSYIVLLLAIHQVGPFLLFLGEPEMANPAYEAHAFLEDFRAKFGDRHRSLGHGMLHGTEIGLFTGLALIGTTAMIEGQSMKRAWVHIGFWVVSCALIGGVLSAFF